MQHLFSAAGPDKNAYEQQVVFRDPISTYSSLSSEYFGAFLACPLHVAVVASSVGVA